MNKNEYKTSFIEVRSEDLPKISDLLQKNDYDIDGTYYDVEEIIVSKESTKIGFETYDNTDLNSKQSVDLMHNVYDELFENKEKLINNDYIQEVKEKHLKKFMTRE